MSYCIDPHGLPEPYKTRVMVWRDTQLLCRALTKQSGQSGQSTQSTKRIASGTTNTITTVVPSDTLDAARGLLAAGARRVAVLNLADPGCPGGCVHTGSGAQEESLFRRTTLCMHLPMEPGLYPLEEDAALVSGGVTVLRDTEARGYRVFGESERFTVDVVSCAGVRHPTPTPDGHMSEEDKRTLLKKVRLVYACARDIDCDCLVLGALGCGAFRCPPHDVAAVFRRVNDEYEGVFRRVVFAVMPPAKDMLFAGHTVCDNFGVFQRLLGGPSPSVAS